MRLSRPRQVLPVLMGLVFLAGSCSSGSDNDEGADLQSVTVTTSVSTTTTAATTTITEPVESSTSSTTAGEPQPATGAAISFKSLAPDIVGVSDGVLNFVDGLDPVRIDELAATSCDAVLPSMGAAELGVEGFTAYDDLSIEERAALELDDWVVLFGALLGFFCPQNLPDLDLESTPTDGTEVERFRGIVTEVSGVSAETEAFVAAAADDRIDELQSIACAASSPDLTTDDFGVIIVQSYDTDLTEAEQGTIGLAAYSELYGAIVGWFCPGNLPR